VTTWQASSIRSFGAYIVGPGKVFLDDGAVPVVATKKWLVTTSGARILTD
jgi:hypothetical protein